MTKSEALCGAEKLFQAAMALQKVASGDYSEQGVERLQRQTREALCDVLLALDAPRKASND